MSSLETYRAAYKLLNIPQRLWPYLLGREKAEQIQQILDKSKQGNQELSGWWGSWWSGVGNIASDVGGVIKDVGSWSLDAIDTTFSTITGKGGSIPESVQEIILPSEEMIPKAESLEITEKATESISWADRLSSAFGSFWDFAKEVGVPLAGAWLKFDITKDIYEKKMEQGASKKEAMNYAMNSQEANKKQKAVWQQTLNYVNRNWSTISKMGYSNPEQAAKAILYATGGSVPQSSISPGRYLGGPEGGQVNTMSNIGQFLQQYWWLAAGGLLFIVLMRR